MGRLLLLYSGELDYEVISYKLLPQIWV
jgi:hypothetical protein